MQSLKIEVLNPKALKLLKGMQELDLIKVSQEPKIRFKDFLNKSRKNSKATPTLEEITSIVENVRQKRYDKK